MRVVAAGLAPLAWKLAASQVFEPMGNAKGVGEFLTLAVPGMTSVR